MKVYYQAPAQDVLIVKPDPEVEEYEFWVLTPTLVGSASKAGTQRVMCDGLQFTNLSSAAQHCLLKSGHRALAGKPRHFTNQATAKTAVTGVKLAANNVWSKFAKARKLDVESTEAISRTYYLTTDEMKKLGLKPERTKELARG